MNETVKENILREAFFFLKAVVMSDDGAKRLGEKLLAEVAVEDLSSVCFCQHEHNSTVQILHPLFFADVRLGPQFSAWALVKEAAKVH